MLRSPLHPRGGPCARARAALLGLALACIARAAPPAEGGGWEHFPAFVWRLDHAAGAIPEELVQPFGGVNVEGPEAARDVLERGLQFFVDHLPGRDELHLERGRAWYEALWARYERERDASVLVRRPCLSEPATWEALRAELERSLAARGGQHGLFASLGDEVGLTPYGDPLDLCASTACRARWREHLARELPRMGIEADPASVPFPSTDEARRAWAMGDARLLGPWLARRRFHHEVVRELLERLARRARELTPKTPIGLVGLGGRTAFGGFAVEEALEFLDLVEPYRVGDARELGFTLRQPGQRILRTIFPESDAPQGPAWQLWEHALRGGDGVVLWCDRDLARDEFYRARLARAVLELRRLRERGLAAGAPPAGVAVLHSPDSLALSWLRESIADGPSWVRRFAGYHEEHGARERALRAWLRLAEDAGFLPGSLPISRLEGSDARRFPLLVASHLWVLGPLEEARLASHLAAGGSLLVHGPFARYDAFGRRTEGALQRLSSIAPERVTLLDDARARELARYLDARSSSSGARAAELVGWFRARAEAAGAPSPPWRIRAPSIHGWLCAHAAGKREGEWLAMALPNLGERGERSRLVDLELSIEHPPGWRIEWIHPLPGARGAVLLPAGDAALLRLRAPDRTGSDVPADPPRR